MNYKIVGLGVIYLVIFGVIYVRKHQFWTKNKIPSKHQQAFSAEK